MIALALLFMFHPLLYGVAPMFDMLGSVGLDGLMVLLEVQLMVWSLPGLRQHIVPALTRRWNQYVAPRLGIPASGNVFSDAMLAFFHFLLCRGGVAGVVLYFFYLALLCHVAPHAPLPVA